MCIILVGPFCTLLLLLFGMLIDFPQVNIFIMTQLLIFGLNLLPIFPLDGGRIIHSIFPKLYEELIGFSGCICVIIFVVSLYYFPNGFGYLHYLFIFCFTKLFVLEISKYKLAFDCITKSA